MANKVNSETLLSPIIKWLDDDLVTEIVLNQPNVIFVERDGYFVRHEVAEFDSRRLAQLFRLIANENHQELSESKPILSGVLINGMRVQLIHPPVSRYYSFAIRKKSQRQFSLNYLAEQDYFNKTQSLPLKNQFRFSRDDTNTQLQNFYRQRRWPEFIKLALISGKNIVVSGATSSGKTSFLNACLNELPLSERLIILEDTPEVIIKHENSLRLLACKGQQGTSSITMQDLLQCSLRLRPDRIIVGEVRGKELLEYIAASLTGHRGAITTIHAENPSIALIRMCQMYKLNALPAMTDNDIYKEIKQAVDIIFQLKKTTTGRRLASVYFSELVSND